MAISPSPVEQIQAIESAALKTQLPRALAAKANVQGQNFQISGAKSLMR